MPWPTPQDYNEAIQNPGLSFADPELRTGAPETTSLGLPRPITGNFASVYRVRCAGGDWAVRCFFREFADMQERYAAISAHVPGAAPGYTVGFEYQPTGIRIRNGWYPILKMEWVEGQLLHDYLASHLGDGPALDVLAGRWLAMVAALERSGCAHGDLQHGNVLICGDEIKLVDYDGMYVPALAGRGSHELGHQNFQHPGRGAADFGPGLDRFAAWVIYLSIVAVRSEPELWAASGAGDECLLFRRQDFERPDASPILNALLGHSDDRVRGLAARFRAALDGPPAQVPSPARGGSVHADPGRRARVPVRLALLWRELVPTLPAEEGGEPPPVASHPAWLADQLAAQRAAANPASDMRVEGLRVALLASLLASCVGGVALSTAVAPAAALSIAVCLWLLAGAASTILAYRRQPAVRRALPLIRRDLALRRALVALERERRGLERRREQLLSRQGAVASQAERRRAALERRRERARRDAEARTARRLETLDARLRAVDLDEETDLASALGDLQMRHVSEALRRASLRSAAIPGLSRRLKLRLLAMGIWAAADVTSERIAALRSLGRETVMAVVTWRVEQERLARSTMPRELPAGARRVSALRHTRARERLQVEREAVQENAWGAVASIDERFVGRLVAIDRRSEALLADLAQQRADLDRRIAETQDDDRRVQHALTENAADVFRLEGLPMSTFLRAAFLPFEEGKKGPSGEPS